MNSFHKYYLSVFSNKFTKFEGRADRREFWMYTLFNTGIVIALWLVDLIVFKKGYSVFLSIYALFKLIPELALSVRRLHDIDKSGYHLLYGLIPVVGSIYLIVLFCRDGTPGMNQYGTSTIASPPQSAQPYTHNNQKVVSPCSSSKIPADIRSKWKRTSSSTPPASSPSYKSNGIANGVRRKW